MFHCTDDPNDIIGHCNPGPNLILCVILTVGMWWYTPSMVLELGQSKPGRVVELTKQFVELAKNSLAIIVGWAWTGNSPPSWY